MNIFRPVCWIFVGLAALMVAPIAAHADALTDEAKRLIDSGNSKAAYDLLSPHESARAGEESYDLLLGIAAADIGRNTNAVLALERVLALNPNNARARAEIARAYFGLGEVKAARQEFDTVKQQGIPPEVAKTIDKFLSAVERLEEAGQTTTKGFLEVSYGADSNATGGANNREFVVPGLPPATLASGFKQSDDFSSLAAGLNFRKPLDPRMAVLAGISASQRLNNKLDQFDVGTVDANLGLNIKDDKDNYTVSLQAGTYTLDNNRYRDSLGLVGQWTHTYNQRTQSSLFAQYTDLRYAGAATLYNGKTRDAGRFVAGGGIAHALRDFKTIFFGSAYAGFEDTHAQPTAELDYDLYGIRAGGQHQYSDDLMMFANLGYENRSYRAPDLNFLTTRKDDTFSLTLGVAYSPAKNWKITPQYQVTDNRSNISINRYTRDVVSVTVRYEF